MGEREEICSQSSAASPGSCGLGGSLTSAPSISLTASAGSDAHPDLGFGPMEEPGKVLALEAIVEDTG